MNRLPITHPDYRYPPSRNPYWEKNKILQGRILSDNDTEAHAGHWRESFADPKLHSSSTELQVEIGCNAGHVIVEWAKLNPGKAYIGLDWKFKMIHKAAEKGIKRKLDNLLFFRAQAERIRFIFGESELDRLNIFFPDPWPKKSQWKHRYLKADRLRDFAYVLKPGAILHIKTDHPGYFEWILEGINQTQELWETLELTRDLHAGNPKARELQIPDVTLFERLFVADGLPIHSVQLRVKK